MAEEKGPTAPPGLKIVVVGLTQGGKTTVSNYIASDEAVDFEYPLSTIHRRRAHPRVRAEPRRAGDARRGLGRGG